MFELADIGVFDSLSTSTSTDCCVFNAIDLRKGIDLTKQSTGIDLTKKSDGGGIDLTKHSRGTREGNDVLMRLQQLQRIANTVLQKGDTAEKENLANIYRSILQAANYSYTRLVGDKNATLTVARTPEANRQYSYNAFR